MSDNKKEYDVLKGLLNGKQVNTLDNEVILSCVAKRSVEELGDSPRVYVLHDPCDIRKPYASDMEDLGKVLSLQKQVVSGYSSFNSVAVVPDNQEVHLLDSVLYSNGSADYVSQEKVNLIKSAKGAKKVLKDKKGNKIKQEEIDLVERDLYQNGSKIAQNQIQKSSRLLREGKPDRILSHVLDREYDDESIFDQIDDLGDEFVIRLKLNRNSQQQEKVYTPNGKLSKKVKYKKLIDKQFAHQTKFIIDKLHLKGKVYSQVNALVEWESLQIGHKNYTVVRIGLSCGTKALFDKPMLLLTNRPIENAQDACQVYKTYILRFKIEVVFRFLKQNMGWESFQVRDFNSIKNLLALVFFLVGYFKELEEELSKHPLATFLCSLALSKGKITIFYLLEGLEKIIAFQQTIIKMKENNVSIQEVEELLEQLNLSKKWLLRSYQK